jgi:DNA-binding CsgD family transcriptional regulator
MERLTQQQLQVLLKFVRGFYACHDRDAFISYLLYGISTVISVELTVFAEVDDGGRVIDVRVEPAPVTCPDFRQLFELYFPQHPHFTYYQQTGDASAIKLSDLFNKRQLRTLELYSDLYEPMKVEHMMGMVLPGSRLCSFAMSLHRGRRDFSEQERLTLNLLRPHLVQAFANVETIGVMRQKVGLLVQAMEAKDQGVVLLTKDGRVRLINGRAQYWLGEYFGCSSGRADLLPDVFRAWLAHQESALHVKDDIPLARKPFVVERKGECLVVRHLCEADRCILVMEQQPTIVHPAAFKPSDLTGREAEVLLWVAQGKTNAEVGAILDMSSRTVQKHLEHIFKKLGVETRVAATRVLASESLIRKR